MADPHAGARLPGLDGLRALSIGCVLIGHAGYALGYADPKGAIAVSDSGPIPSLDLGNLGVRVFFVLSGFLITTLLLAERERTGRISLGQFFARRAFRIFPACYAYIAIVGLLGALGVLAADGRQLAYATTYAMNYLPDRGWYLGHLWSVAVEEQFYLVWPLLLVVFGNRRALLGAGAFMVALAAVRWLWWRGGGDISGIDHQFHFVADAMAAGCVLAGIRPWLDTHPLAAGYRRFQRHIGFAVVPLAVIAMLLVRERPSIDLPVGISVMNVGIALCIDWVVRNHHGRIGRILDHRALVYVGTLSYSLYLWQQLFLAHTPQSIAQVPPLSIVCAFAAAVVSYHAIERPFLRLRARVVGDSRGPQVVQRAAADLEPGAAARHA